jgi:hypothetical protein
MTKDPSHQVLSGPSLALLCCDREGTNRIPSHRPQLLSRHEWLRDRVRSLVSDQPFTLPLTVGFQWTSELDRLPGNSGGAGVHCNAENRRLRPPAHSRVIAGLKLVPTGESGTNSSAGF